MTETVTKLRNRLGDEVINRAEAPAAREIREFIFVFDDIQHLLTASQKRKLIRVVTRLSENYGTRKRKGPALPDIELHFGNKKFILLPEANKILVRNKDAGEGDIYE